MITWESVTSSALDHLPKVQRLLGHKRLQTTIDHYAELDETLISNEWLAHLDSRSAA